nr:reverse transcriptase domain-containing protein [Tanacetum cinerariifolium]
MKRRPEECYDLIENMTAHHNDWDTSAQRSESSSSITSSFDTKITALEAEMAEINKNLMRVLQVNQQVKAVTPNSTVGNTQNVYAVGAYQGNSHQPQGNRNLLSYRSDNYLGPPGNTITNPKEDLKGITTRRGTAYPGPTIPTTSSSPVVERETEATKDTVHPTNNGSTEDVQPPVVPTESLILNSEPVNSLIIEPIASPIRRALINVFKVKLTLRVGKEAITFNLDQTSRYLTNYNDMTAKRIDVIDMACEEYSQEVLGFSDEIAKVELKDLPPHLEYAFLEGDDKFPVIIAKYLSVEEKTALITVLKSHKRAIAWKLSDIKGIDPECYIHKILMEE